MKKKEIIFAMDLVLKWEHGFALEHLVLKNNTLTFCEEVDINDSIHALIQNSEIDIDDPAVQELLSDMNKYVVVILKEIKDEKVKKTESSLISLTNGADYVVAYLANKGTMNAIKLKLTLVDGMTNVEVVNPEVDFGDELVTWGDGEIVPG